jgi:solute:Na+ symporter, SSS family
MSGCLLGGTVVVLYFATGGLKGTAWINLFQLLVKGAGFLIAFPLVYYAVGGWSGIAAQAPSGDYLSITGGGWVTVLPFLVLLAPSFIVSPGLIQKVYGARDTRTVRMGVGLNGVVLLLFSFIPVLLGMAAASRFPQLASPELALPTVITELLPVGLGAILLAAVFSAEVSSADAILFMLSTSLTRDLYKRLLRPDIDDQSQLRISRLTAFAAGGLAVLLGLLLESVVDALRIFYGLLSVALFAPVVVGLYRTRPGAAGGLAAVLASVAAAGIFHLLTGGAGIGPLSSTAFGILVSFLLLALTSLRR